MKLRIQGNSLRLRLSEKEVQDFVQTGRVEESVSFGPDPEQTFHYVLARREVIAAITLEFTGKTIMVYIPEPVAAAWADDTDISLTGLVENGTAHGLKVLVEKDLDCRH